MSKKGKFDYKELEELQKEVQKLTDNNTIFLKKVAQEFARIWLNKTVNRVHNVTGTLNRNWKVKVQENEKEYLITISNPLEYSSYVEFGHRTKKRKDGSRGWVEGKFMMTKSKSEVENMTPKILEKMLKKALEEGFK